MILGTFRDKRGGLDRHIDTDSENEADGSGASQEKLVGWVYVGSHNFTPSAWGTLSGSAFNPTLNVRLSSLLCTPTRKEWKRGREADDAADHELRAWDTHPAAQSRGD